MKPATETQRLAALRRYQILDTGAEKAFDDLTALAAHVCGAPIAVLSLVDEDRVWFKSKVGIIASEGPRDVAFCAHSILQPELFVVADAQADERFAANPSVTGELRLRFYAGAPLITPEGHAIGVLCVCDRVPRELTAAQREALQALAGQAMAQLELRRQVTELDRTRQQLMETLQETSLIGEVASTVLHNVGNVLNSVTVSAALVSEKVRKSKVANLTKVAELVRAHQSDLAAFLNHNEQGRQVPGYLVNLAQHLTGEQTELAQELKGLCANIEHIKEIIALQQGYAKMAGLVEVLPVADLINDALRLNEGSLSRHQVEVVREFADVPPVAVQKHSVLQILVNLIRNAKHALDAGGQPDKRLILRVAANGGNMVNVAVIDNGVGIPLENMARIFEYGFTTRKDGHGFGLHSAAQTAQALGGTLSAHSDGPGQGSTFTLSLPRSTNGGTV